MATHVFAHGQELSAFAFEQITVNGAVGFTSATFNPSNTGGPAQRAVVTVETDQVRYTIDGTTPTSTVGHLLAVGDVLVLEGRKNLSNAKFIKVTNNATISCTYERLFVRGA